MYGDGADALGREREAPRLAARCEQRRRDRVLLRARRRRRWSPTSSGAAELRYLHRPANLEDVFLKLTGRDLRD